MAVAVLQQRAGLRFGRCDIYAATVGGVRLTEPAIDLAISLALAGTKLNVSLPSDVVAFGEVGLAGEIRSVTGVGRRLAEAGRMGFRRALVPVGTDAIAADCTMQVSQVEDVVSAIRTGFDLEPGQRGF